MKSWVVSIACDGDHQKCGADSGCQARSRERESDNCNDKYDEGVYASEAAFAALQR